MITKEEVERFQLTYDTLKIQERVLRASAVTGITIEEVARSLSVDIDLPVQERLKSWPKSSMRVIVHLSKLLGVSVPYLLTGEASAAKITRYPHGNRPYWRNSAPVTTPAIMRSIP